MAVLEGKTVLAGGRGSTPEYIVNDILEQNGLSEVVEVEYLAGHAEAVTQLASGGADVILVPEPFVTNVLGKVEGARVALDITQVWSQVSDSELVQGCLVVRKDFAQEHPDEVEAFLEDYAQSAAYVTENPAQAAQLIEEYGIMASAALAEGAIPNCNIVCITGSQMQTMMTEMLTVLYQANPKSVGGTLPGSELFYSK